MTIEELNDNVSIDDLEKMTDDELMKHFTPYLTATRPDLAAIQRASQPASSGRSSNSRAGDNAADEARKIAQQFGFKLNI